MINVHDLPSVAAANDLLEQVCRASCGSAWKLIAEEITLAYSNAVLDAYRKGYTDGFAEGDA